jgi:hypothetical protein
MSVDWRGRVAVFAVGLAVLQTGCTIILGDFKSGNGEAPEAGASSGSSTGDFDASSTPDVSMSSDDGGTPPVEAGPTGCGADQISCPTGCVSPDDLHTCGGCNVDCTLLPHVAAVGLTCTAGVCTGTCSPGYKHCSSNPGDICETDLSQVGHCGDCNTTCSGSTPLCALENTDGGAADAGQGTYACSSGCPGTTTPCSGTCADLTSDNSHCGGCGTVCTGGTQCQNGQCLCPAGTSNCNGTCYQTQTDPAHCGTSCTSCPAPNNGHSTCSAGVCGQPCNPGFSTCGGATNCAYDTNNDSSHCGANCGTCSATDICSGGTCVCGAGPYQLCNGTCTNTDTDPANCGSCGNSCPYGCDGHGGCKCQPVPCGHGSCGCVGEGMCCGTSCC